MTDNEESIHVCKERLNSWAWLRGSEVKLSKSIYLKGSISAYSVCFIFTLLYVQLVHFRNCDKLSLIRIFIILEGSLNLHIGLIGTNSNLEYFSPELLPAAHSLGFKQFILYAYLKIQLFESTLVTCRQSS